MAKRVPLLPGYQYGPGYTKTRLFLDPRGAVITRRQYDNVRRAFGENLRSGLAAPSDTKAVLWAFQRTPASPLFGKSARSIRASKTYRLFLRDWASAPSKKVRDIILDDAQEEWHVDWDVSDDGGGIWYH